MDQNNKNQTQGQNQQGMNKQPESGNRGNPSTTERIQPDQGGGTQKPEGETKQGNQPTKF